MKRRRFLSSGAALAGLPLLSPSIAQALTSDSLATTSIAEAITENIDGLVQEIQTREIADPASFAYWTELSRRVDPYTPGKTVGKSGSTAASAQMSNKDAAQLATLSGGAAEMVTAPISDSRKPTFVIYTSEHGFRDVVEIADSELIEDGSVDVTVLVNTLRPSRADVGILERAVGGSLKLDFGQKEPASLPPLQNALAWSSIGVLAATSAGKNLPKLESLKLEAPTGTLFGTPQKIPLVGGAGQWRWSFYVQKKESNWLKALRFIGSLGRVAGAATPAVFGALGLPAIAWAALSAVDNLYAYLHAKEVTSDWLYQGLQTPVVATREARTLGAVPLRKGLNQYLVVPRHHSAGLAQQGLLEISKNGFVVPRGTSLLEAPRAALTTATDVTYIAMTVEVTSRPKSSC
jgi:hypothetical protein